MFIPYIVYDMISLKKIICTVATLIPLGLVSCRSDIPAGGASGTTYQNPAIVVPVGRLKSPRGIAVDQTGDIWVSDSYSNVIRRISPGGSDKTLFTAIPFPTKMGFDRATSNILVIIDQNSILSISPSNDEANIVFGFSASAIDTSSVFDVTSGIQTPRMINTITIGDVDGAPNGDLYVSTLANDAENFLIRVRNGIATAIAFSPLRPTSQTERVPHFLSTDRFGDVYTSFVTGVGASGTTTNLFAIVPGNLLASQRFSAIRITPTAQGSGIDATGRLFIAEPSLQQVVLVSTADSSPTDYIILPFVQGMGAPTPRDVALAPNGDIYVAVSDFLDTSNTLGAVIVYKRNPSL